MEELRFNDGVSTYQSFEIELCVRDKNGNPTGETKSLRTNSADELAQFWHGHQPKPKRLGQKGKKKKNLKKRRKEYVPNKREADTILEQLRKKTAQQERND